MDKYFSIIMPNYNNGEIISKAIESIINQTYKNWKLYIVDDMSTDNSVEEIEKYDDERIQLGINKCRLYNGGSRNIAILRAKEENPNGYILFVDSDDWLYSNTVLEELNEFIDNEDMITLGYLVYYGQNDKKTEYKRLKSKNIDEIFMTKGCTCAVWQKCVKVSICPLFEFNTLMEDRNFHYRLVNRVKEYKDFDKTFYVYNKTNPKSVTTTAELVYDSKDQSPLSWNNCAYRHVAGMKDLLNEIEKPEWAEFIQKRIEKCLQYARRGMFYQL